MYDNGSVGEQILNGVFKALWIIALPFIGLYRLLKWFVVGVTRETGNRMIKIVGGAIAVGIVGYISTFFFN